MNCSGQERRQQKEILRGQKIFCARAFRLHDRESADAIDREQERAFARSDAGAIQIENQWRAMGDFSQFIWLVNLF